MYKLSNLIIYIYVIRNLLKSCVFNFQWQIIKQKPCPQTSQSSFLVRFIEDLNYPKPATLGDQNFASLKLTVSHPWQVATIPQKTEFRGNRLRSDVAPFQGSKSHFHHLSPKKGRNLPGVPERVHEVNMQLTTFSGHQLDAKNSSRTRNTPKNPITSHLVVFLVVLL